MNAMHVQLPNKQTESVLQITVKEICTRLQNEQQDETKKTLLWRFAFPLEALGQEEVSHAVSASLETSQAHH